MDKVWWLLIAAIVLVAIWWYATREYRGVPDDRVLDLSGSGTPAVISSWYDQHLKPALDAPANAEVGARLISRLFHMDVPPQHIIIGTDLDVEYQRLTGADPIINPVERTDEAIYNLRDLIGRPLQIAVIADRRLRRRMAANSTDGADLHAIMESGLDVLARDHLREILKHRWGLLVDLRDSRILNRGGSYVYVENFDLPGVTTHEMPDGCHRIDLLCSETEFAGLISRWRARVVAVA